MSLLSYFPLRSAPRGLPAGALALVLLLAGCGGTQALPVPVARVRREHAVQRGVASWHGPSRFDRDSRTASSRKWVSSELVAAHRTLPLGTMVAVQNLRNGRRVIVQITDRGPYARGRMLDLSLGAAEVLGMCEQGTANVRLEVLPPSVDERSAAAAPAVISATLPVVAPSLDRAGEPR